MKRFILVLLGFVCIMVTVAAKDGKKGDDELLLLSPLAAGQALSSLTESWPVLVTEQEVIGGFSEGTRHDLMKNGDFEDDPLGVHWDQEPAGQIFVDYENSRSGRRMLVQGFTGEHEEVIYQCWGPEELVTYHDFILYASWSQSFAWEGNYSYMYLIYHDGQEWVRLTSDFGIVDWTMGAGEWHDVAYSFEYLDEYTDTALCLVIQAILYVPDVTSLRRDWFWFLADRSENMVFLPNVARGD